MGRSRSLSFLGCLVGSALTDGEPLCVLGAACQDTFVP